MPSVPSEKNGPSVIEILLLDAQVLEKKVNALKKERDELLEINKTLERACYKANKRWDSDVKKLLDKFGLLTLKFKSVNGVPVDRITISRTEWFGE